MVDEISHLHQHADMSGAQPGSRRFRAAREPLPHHVDISTIRLVEAGQAREQSRLAAAGRAKQCDEFTGIDGEIDPAKRRRFVVAVMKEAIEARGDQRRHFTSASRTSP
ncbi:hypothetical protein GGR25_003481 [Kaistia hirudinis]|uniref:Uncharacterized protein n=1 Tax=Kaistia hirudinis TaxID=1293440 RepID=A0A840AT46_9HYPH|nr:hypothetical protein [Kaistia hirudinis]